jgi:hypothetical protein
VFKNISPTHPSSRVKTSQEDAVRSMGDRGSGRERLTRVVKRPPETGEHEENGTVNTSSGSKPTGRIPLSFSFYVDCTWRVIRSK